MLNALILLIGCQGTPEGSLIDNWDPYELERAAPPLDLWYQGTWAWGESVTLHVDGADPGEAVYIAFGTGVGMGPCPVQLGGACLDVTGPVGLAGTGVADGSGTASVVLSIPNGTGDFYGAVQAVAIRGVGGVGSVLSNARDVHVWQLPYNGPTVLDSAEVFCDGSLWTYHAFTRGWTSSGIVNAWETGNYNGWDEEHQLPSVAFDPLQY